MGIFHITQSVQKIKLQASINLSGKQGYVKSYVQTYICQVLYKGCVQKIMMIILTAISKYQLFAVTLTGVLAIKMHHTDSLLFWPTLNLESSFQLDRFFLQEVFAQGLPINLIKKVWELHFVAIGGSFNLLPCPSLSSTTT